MFLPDARIPGKSAIARTVFIALLLIGASSLLLYYFVLIPRGETKNSTSTQQGEPGPMQVSGKTTTAVQGHATATPPMNAQRQATTPTQITVQVTPQASPTATVNTEATAQARANAQATATAIVVASTTPLYHLNNSKLGDHFYTTSAKERDNAAANPGYQSEGTAAYVFSRQVTHSVPLYRLYSGKLGDHFYTTSATERDTAVSKYGYTYEGIAAYVLPG